MAKIAVCKKCGKVYEHLPIIETVGGTTYTRVTCPHCGNIRSDTINHIHYGNDAKT